MKKFTMTAMALLFAVCAGCDDTTFDKDNIARIKHRYTYDVASTGELTVEIGDEDDPIYYAFSGAPYANYEESGYVETTSEYPRRTLQFRVKKMSGGGETITARIFVDNLEVESGSTSTAEGEINIYYTIEDAY
ncbi:MAG TPA: hypothetical protein PK573_10870 [Spirochaetota bacterium]|nr:hypothetical protein [Spirochaetota bacterium]HRZ29086.1 hypothetical protein [Spirochaetota bacterium]HSA15880.1 hypothetical protein [Spirochaetota bacterium]